MAEIYVGPSDNGNLFKVRQGDVITIRLPENPTTGYRWTVDSVDNDILTPEEAQGGSDFYEAPDTGFGGGGWRMLRWKAEDVGTTQLRLKLLRPWEGDHSTVDRYGITVQVED